MKTRNKHELSFKMEDKKNKEIAIEWEKITEALELESELFSDDFFYCLDLETGKVLLKYDEDISGKVDDLSTCVTNEQLNTQPDRYEMIEPMDSRAEFQWMENFAYNQKDEKVQRMLLHVLGMQKPFRRFKDALYEFPEVRKRWFKYRENEIRKYAEEWIQSLTIKVRNAPD